MFLDVCGHRLEVAQLAGSPSLPTLVFLHEGLGSVSLWKDFPAEVAAATGCPAVVYSRYGHGLSDPRVAPFGVDYMHREALDTLPALLDALAIDEPILVGHSDGGSIALLYAAEHDAVRALVLFAPHVFVEDLSVRSIADARVAFETTDLPERLARHHADERRTFYQWNDIWLSPQFRTWTIEGVLPRIACPVLAVQGEDDEYGTLAQLEAISTRVAGRSELVTLRNCRHSPHRDQPAATLEAVTRFVRRVTAR